MKHTYDKEVRSMREIEFRGKKVNNNEWLYGDLMHDNIGGCYIYPIDAENLYKENAVIPDTIGQFTGLLDKNGKKVYQGDIIRYADIDSFVVNPDCDSVLQFSENYVTIKEDVVEFNNGAFVLSDEIYHRTISSCGFDNINDILECVDVGDDGCSDCNGTIINESLLGIEVIGNIHDNPEP